MEFAFDAFRRVFELVLNVEFVPGMNMLSIGLLVLTLWSAFRFFIFPLFSHEDMSDTFTAISRRHVSDHKPVGFNADVRSKRKRGKK